MTEPKQLWDARGVTIALAQLVIGAVLLVVAAIVPTASGLVHYGEMLLATAVAGAILPGVRR